MLSTKKSPDSVGIAVSRPTNTKPTIVYLDDDYRLEKNEVVGQDIEVLPLKSDKIEREVIAAFGASGSGKSHQAMSYVKLYAKMWKHENDGAGRDIFLISKVEGDVTFSPISKLITPIPLDIDIINEIEVAELEPCLFLFDDIDQIADKHLNIAVNRLLMSILELGRHNGISCFITQHLVGTGTDLKRSRTILNETHRVLIFPAGTGAHSVRYFLSKHVGIDSKDEIERIRNLKSRWVCIHRRYPLYVIYSGGAYIIK